jgi:hypothetical protein
VYRLWAPQYRTRLWTGVLPLPRNAKAPLPKGFSGRAGAYPDDEQVQRWMRERPTGNIALRMPGDVLGIDVDAYDYTYPVLDEQKNPIAGTDGAPLTAVGTKTGDLTLYALEAELGPLPPTWRSSSRGDGPSGIRFFRVPPGLLWGDLGEHLEGIWWGHRYAVVYPSINPDSGLRYQWIDETADEPVWGVDPPKVTDLTELPEAWTARFGRAADAPRPPRAPRAPRPDTPRAAVAREPEGSREFTRAQAAAWVQPYLDRLRSAGIGSINIELNTAAKVISHFVPTVWKRTAAEALLLDALNATAYDGKSWQAEATVASAMNSAVADWTAVLLTEAEAAQRAKERARRKREAEQAERAALMPTVADVAAADRESLWAHDWEKSDGLSSHDAESDGPPEPPTASDAVDALIDGFWDRRPFLRYVHTYARSRYCAPWAVLGSVLALAAAAVEPNIQLPPVIGKEASLNLFVGLVGPSGSGKDIAFGIAEELLDIRHGEEKVRTDIIPLGSGEGISHVYMKHPPKLTRRRGKSDDDSALIGLTASSDEPIQYRTRALLTVAEIDTLDAQTKRQGSTVGGQLRQGWSGSQIGFHYADTAKRMIVPKHAYRMCLVAGIQPGRAQMLLSGPESDGGTPQRFLWLPATDPGMGRDAPATPAPVAWTPPAYRGTVLFDVCPKASDTIVDAHIARQTGQGEALDGHALLTRLKVAAALAMLDSRDPRMQCTVTDEDWDLAGVLMAVSDRTRESVRAHLAEASREQNVRQAFAEAQKAVVIAETVESTGLNKALKWVKGKITSEWVTDRTLKRAVKSTIREHLDAALEALIESGEAESEEYRASGVDTRRYRRRE